MYLTICPVVGASEEIDCAGNLIVKSYVDYSNLPRLGTHTGAALGPFRKV